LGKLAGIDVYVHATFLLLIGWIAWSTWVAGKDIAATLAAVAFILALFGCVVLHELGHALTARRYGIRTRDITLLPIGGVARLERMPEDPKQELWVALAGPAVNVAIAAALYVWVGLSGASEALSQLSFTRGTLVERLLVANLSLAVFNLIPAFPMDGGRVVRALLASHMEYTQATQIAASLGQGVALLFGFIGLLSNPFLVFIALFVWIGATQEAAAVQMKSAFSGTPIRQAMITEFMTLSPADTLAAAVRAILSGSQQDFPVVENDRVVGVLTRADLLVALAQHGQGPPVSDVMRRDFQTADAAEMLDAVFARLQECPCHTLPVLQNARLKGLLTMDNLGEFMMIQSALGKARAAGIQGGEQILRPS
jgi:Zn-dependent protease